MSTNNLFWYQIFFERRDLIAGADVPLVIEFIRFMHQLQFPEGLALFEPQQRPDAGAYYYLSTPELHSYEIKKILSNYRCLSISFPQLEKLSVFAGKSILSTVQTFNEG